MTVPIFIGDQQEGKLSIARQGNFTVFEADLRDVGRVVRLRVYGEGGEGYLGVPMPANGRLTLCKRLSPAGLRGFPKTPLYAAETRRTAGPDAPKEEARAEDGAGTHVLWHGGKPHYF